MLIVLRSFCVHFTPQYHVIEFFCQMVYYCGNSFDLNESASGAY